MTLPEVLTYIALLITAYGATQNYIRLKFKLVPRYAISLFFLSLLILYISTFSPLTKALTERAAIQVLFDDWIWRGKYFIIVTLNLFSMYLFFKLSNLRRSNQKSFLNLVFLLKSESNETMLNKLIYDNIDKIVYIKFHESFGDKLVEKIRKKSIVLLPNIKVSFWRKAKRKTFKGFYFILNKIYNKESFIDEIFDNTIENHEFIINLSRSNEQLGIKILKSLVDHKAFGLEFPRLFLVETLKNHKSFVYKNFVEKTDSDVSRLLLDNQEFEKLDLGLNICWAILELIEQNSNLMIKVYEESENNLVLQTISELMYRLSKLDANKLHLSNLPYYIEQELLKYSQLEEERDGTVAFNLLTSFFRNISSLQEKIDPESEELNLLNYIYSGLPAKDYSKIAMIRLGCSYMTYLFDGNYTKIPFEKRIKQFNELFENYEYSYGGIEHLKVMFLTLLDKRRKRDYCHDWIHYGSSPEKREQWELLQEYLENLDG